MDKIDDQKSKHLKPDANERMRYRQSKDKPFCWGTWTNGWTIYKNQKTKVHQSTQRRQSKFFLWWTIRIKKRHYWWQAMKERNNHRRQMKATTDLPFNKQRKLNSRNPSATSVSILSPQKQHYLPDNREGYLGAIGKRQNSNFSPRSSGEDLNWKWKSPRMKRAL